MTITGWRSIRYDAATFGGDVARQMNDNDYDFGEFRLAVSTRELRRGGELQRLPRRVFDCLVHLIEHRDRAVGRDELVAAVWGRVDVADVQVTQLVTRVRRALGDDAETQQVIRTVSGFGYRWIAPVRLAGAEAAPHDAPEVPAADAQRPRRRFGLALAVALLAGLSLIFVAYFRQMPGDAPSGEVAAVLPFEIDAPRDAAWLRLGGMDLVAGRLRDAGLPVPASESVLGALRGRTGDAAPDDGMLSRALGARWLVRGTASRQPQGWRVTLETATPGGPRHRVEAQHEDPLEASRRAADLLAAALGHTPVAAETEQHRSDVVLRQAQAALLANELDTARGILAAAPEPDDAEVRLRLAQVDLKAGRHEAAMIALARLRDEAAVHKDAGLRGRVHVTLGDVHFRRGEFAAAEADYDAAVEALAAQGSDGDRARAVQGRGMARMGQTHFDDAAADLGRARLLFAQAGETLGVAQAEAGLGRMELERRHFDQAVPHLTQAIERFEAFGAVERVLAVSLGLFDVYAQQLRWPEALAVSDRQWALRDGAGDPGLGIIVAARRGRALAALGRLAQAQRLLGETRERYAGAQSPSLRYLYDFEADLAWRQARPDDALAAVERALATWPAGARHDHYARLLLLRQRAQIATGKPAAPVLPPIDGADEVAPALDVVSAEWAVHEGRDDEAATHYAAALRAAEARGVPAELSLVAGSYGSWLLARGRRDEAGALAGRLAEYATRDFDSALFQLAVMHAYGRPEPWADALRQARALAGERPVPENLAVPP